MFEQYEKNKKNLKQIIFLFNIKIKVIAAAFLTRKKKKKKIMKVGGVMSLMDNNLKSFR